MDIDITEILRALAEGKQNDMGDYWSPSWCKNAAEHIEALRARVSALEAEREAAQRGVKARYEAAMADDYEPEPVEHLRFFLSLALSPQDWIDVEPLLNDVQARLPDNYIAVPLEAWQELVDAVGEAESELKALREQEPAGYVDSLAGSVFVTGEEADLYKTELMTPVYARHAPQVPDGYVLVPKAPTVQMLAAGRMASLPNTIWSISGVWDAMLSAAQTKEGKP